MRQRSHQHVRDEPRDCLFCRTTTPHAIIISGLRPHWWSRTPSLDVRERAVCQRCGGYLYVDEKSASAQRQASSTAPSRTRAGT